MELNYNERQAVLFALGEYTLHQLQQTPALLSAVIKLSDVNADGGERIFIDTTGKVAAIKLVRFLTGFGLKEAKDYVEGLAVTTGYDEDHFPLITRGTLHGKWVELNKDLISPLGGGTSYANVLRIVRSNSAVYMYEQLISDYAGV